MGTVTPAEKASNLISRNLEIKPRSGILGVAFIPSNSKITMRETLDIKIRKAVPGDIDFITSTWLNSVYTIESRDMKKHVFFENHNRMVKERLPFMKCLVACNPEDEDQIYGYIVYNSPSTLHFGYTKSYYRRFRVFTRLLSEAGIQAPITVTHKAPAFKVLEGKYSFIFNPYLFIEVKNESSQG